MPSLLESIDYESFTLKDWDSEPLSLDEAMKKAASLRVTGKTFCRVVPVDSEMSGFRVEVLTPEEVRERFYSRFAAFRAKWLSRKR
jgi:hypothetical protein